jgi:hypothetical protein
MSTPLPTEKQATPLLSNTVYDRLKWVAQIGLPALGALYFGLAQIWGLPFAGEIVGTITVVDAFLGVLLGLSTKSYNNSDAKYDGALVVDSSNPDRDIYSFQLNDMPESLREKDELSFKVQKPAS